MNIGETVAKAILDHAAGREGIELNVKDYANLRHFGPRLGSEFETVGFDDPRFAEGQHASVGPCRVFVRKDVPELHVRLGSELVRLPYPEGF